MQRGKVLIIEDDADISHGAKMRLRAEGYATVVAADGAAGLEAANRERPDAILLDVRMPVVDGITALKQLKQNRKTRDIPVVMLSASVVDRDLTLEAGAAFFIRKPYAGNALIDAVEAVTA